MKKACCYPHFSHNSDLKLWKWLAVSRPQSKIENTTDQSHEGSQSKSGELFPHIILLNNLTYLRTLYMTENGGAGCQLYPAREEKVQGHECELWRCTPPRPRGCCRTSLQDDTQRVVKWKGSLHGHSTPNEAKKCDDSDPRRFWVQHGWSAWQYSRCYWRMDRYFSRAIGAPTAQTNTITRITRGTNQSVSLCSSTASTLIVPPSSCSQTHTRTLHKASAWNVALNTPQFYIIWETDHLESSPNNGDTTCKIYTCIQNR